MVECGTAACVETTMDALRALGIAPRALHAVLVTHIHLDHAGAAGHFAREGVPVLAHPRGTRHLADPARLIAGSRAVHGARYERFYGDPLPVDPRQLRAVDGGETLQLAGLRVTAIETPGHARHHHAWAISSAGNGDHGSAPELVFVGDVLGMITAGSTFLSLPLPPSDIDIPAWRGSVARLRALPRATTAVLTHGGERPLGTHLDGFLARMHEELPLLGELVALAERDPAAADVRYRDFLLARAAAAGVAEALAHALLGRAFRDMNLAGVRQAVARGLFECSLERP